MSSSAPSAASTTEPPLHRRDQAQLLALVPRDESAAVRPGLTPEALLAKTIGAGTSARMNQGNEALARHLIDQNSCRQGLSGTSLPTDDQQRRCRGREQMVPLSRRGRPEDAKVCIDVFEYPNRPCELPFVWASPTQAAALCGLAGKRLCSQEEWVLACRGDPAGGQDSVYAYGDTFDPTVCHTNRTASDGLPCDPTSAASAWRTCRSDTEPAGAFPRCRSRFGVFDLHGNVAEIMTRRDPEDGQVYSQLKGSAFFYVDVVRLPGAPPPAKSAGKAARETYPDHCAFDPRWHVEPIADAWHVNYHLGFRCCLSL